MAEENEIAQLRQQVEAESREEGDGGGERGPQFEDGFSGKTIIGALFVLSTLPKQRPTQTIEVAVPTPGGNAH